MENRIKKSKIFFYGFIAILGIGLVAAMVTGCGKLNDDTGQPSTPSGTTGYSPIPYGPKSTAGTFTLSMEADPATVPADATNYSTITVRLSNTSGLPVSGYTVKYTADKLYGWFYEPDSGEFVSEAEGLTDQNGASVKRFYGTRSGQGVARAEVDVDRDGTPDLVVSKPVTFTPGGPPNSAGSYSLEISANPKTVYANMANYSIISARLIDSTGGSVENFTITFTSELGYVHNLPTPPSTPQTTASCLTSPDGGCSIYYYADRAGSAIVSASVLIRDLMTTLQARTDIQVLPGPGEPGNDVPGIFLAIAEGSAQYQVETADDTGTADMAAVTLEATVWDATGDVVGPNVRVEFSGDIQGFSNTNENGIATMTFPGRKLGIGSHSFTVKACTYGINPQQTQYCDDISFGITVLPPDPAELEIELIASPEEIQVQGSPATITARVLYEKLPLAGVSVSFNTTLGSLSSASATTNSFGLCSVQLSPGSTPGIATIYAVARAKLPSGGDAGGNKSLEVPIISIPDRLIVDPNPIAISVQLVYTNGVPLGTSPIDVLAIVEDALGNRIDGAEVTFSIMNRVGCDGITFDPPKSTTAQTNSAGVAEPTDMKITARNANSSCTFQMEVVVGDGQGNRKQMVNGTVTAN